MQSIEELKELLEGRLSKKRYVHSLNVADECKKLAKTWAEDEEQAYLAGLLHDICKDAPKAEQKQMVEKSALNISDVERRAEPLWHAIAGAWYAEHLLGIEDVKFLNAIRYHTAGRAEMSRLEEIVYVADLISADRTYKDVNKIRKLAYTNLDKTMLEGLRFSIISVAEKSSQIPLITTEAYNYYLARTQK